MTLFEKLSITLYFNSINNTACNYFPAVCLVSFKQSRYYSNWIRCCAINKKDNQLLNNTKRLTSKKVKKKHYLKGRNFCWKKFLQKMFLRLSSKKLNFRENNFSWLTLFIVVPPSSYDLEKEISIPIYLLVPPPSHLINNYSYISTPPFPLCY